MSTTNHPLKSATSRVLEDWAMMIVDDCAESGQLFDPDQPVYMSWVNIKGVVTGAVSIIAQDPFMNALAANLLGEEDEFTVDERKDAFKEMGNVLAGNFLTEAYGEDVVFDLIDPNVTTIPFDDVKRFLERNVVFSFSADDVPVAVTFSIRGMNDDQGSCG